MLQAPAVSSYSQRQIIDLTRTAAEQADRILDAAGRVLVPGITEGEARRQIVDLMKAFGVETLWHRPYVHFGSNTLLTFMDKPVEEKTLQAEDIAYIDLGPVIPVPDARGTLVAIEGDVGRTYVFGGNPLFHDLKAACERIDAQARAFWHTEQPTGVALYETIHRWTREAGYEFHLNPAGHLIGSFPHTGWKEGLNTYPYVPEPGIWILEVQIRHPQEPYGAFVEAVLI